MATDHESYFETILPTVQENSKTVRNTYISYLAVAAYIWLTVESITHRHLLIPDERLSLPVIGLKLPVVGFFWIAPLLLLLFHIYFVIHLVNFAALLAKVKTRQKNYHDDWKSQIHGSLFTWYFLKPETAKRPGSTITSLLIILSFWLLAPIILLRTQWIFLPYHHHTMTPYHQILVAMGIGISTYFFWKTYAYKKGINFDIWLSELRQNLSFSISTGDRQTWKQAWHNFLNLLASIALPSIYIFIALFSAFVLYIPEKEKECFYLAHCPKFIDWLPPRNLELSEAKLANRPSDILIAAYKDEPDKLLQHYGTLNLQGRDLRFANFRAADLTKADFRKADLQGADLRFAKLQAATFRDALLGKWELTEGDLKKLADLIPEGNRKNAFLKQVKSRRKKPAELTLVKEKLDGKIYHSGQDQFKRANIISHDDPEKFFELRKSVYKPLLCRFPILIKTQLDLESSLLSDDEVKEYVVHQKNCPQHWPEGK